MQDRSLLTTAGVTTATQSSTRTRCVRRARRGYSTIVARAKGHIILIERSLNQVSSDSDSVGVVRRAYVQMRAIGHRNKCVSSR